MAVFQEMIPCDIAHQILQDYLRYHHQYKRINKRAKLRFERKDWHGIQADSRERIIQYKTYVADTTQQIQKILCDDIHDRTIWKQIRYLFFEEIVNFNTRNIAETYYNSVFRHCHRDNQKVDEELMFVNPTVNYHESRSYIPIFNTLFIVKPIRNAISQILHFYDLQAPFEDMDRDISYITQTLIEELNINENDFRSIRLELIKSLFYRNKCAYIVGRIVVDHQVQPIVIPLLHEDKGIYIDTILLHPNQVSSIFSYSRSYFLVDTDIAADMVEFLQSIIPHKALSELYNSLGFINHAKTEFYRDFQEHMRRTQDKFVVAPGIKGMVMSVFTLPSYNMVFKVIKDKFDPPKQCSKEKVIEKYNIVAMHDRVGRMVDSHVFLNLVFDRHRFSDELINELMLTCPSKLTISDDKIEIEHLYIEKKMIPLDIYLSTASEDQSEQILRDYGQALKELARVNIFPGDLLLKNFGVNRQKKVVFYDYDEIEYITDLKFRPLPTARYEDELMSDDWFAPDLNDVFPEQFLPFIARHKSHQEVLMKYCSELFDYKFWRVIQERLAKNIVISVFPYSEAIRFRLKYKETANDLHLVPA